MMAEEMVRQKWHLLVATMDERARRARRLWAEAEADALGYGGVATSRRDWGQPEASLSITSRR
jgi:hypothetical protein